MIFSYDKEFMNIKIYDDIPDIREGKPKEIIEIPDIMDAWEFYKSVVRCKDCMYGSDNKVYGCSLINFNTDEWHRMYANDFCSRGERKESE